MTPCQQIYCLQHDSKGQVGAEREEREKYELEEDPCIEFCTRMANLKSSYIPLSHKAPHIKKQSKIFLVNFWKGSKVVCDFRSTNEEGTGGRTMAEHTSLCFTVTGKQGRQHISTSNVWWNTSRCDWSTVGNNLTWLLTAGKHNTWQKIPEGDIKARAFVFGLKSYKGYKDKALNLAQDTDMRLHRGLL